MQEEKPPSIIKLIHYEILGCMRFFGLLSAKFDGEWLRCLRREIDSVEFEELLKKIEFGKDLVKLYENVVRSRQENESFLTLSDNWEKEVEFEVRKLSSLLDYLSRYGTRREKQG